MVRRGPDVGGPGNRLVLAFTGRSLPLDMVGGFLVGMIGCVSAAILWSLFGEALYRTLSSLYRAFFAIPIRKGWIRD